MERKLLLFDVDGTLSSYDGVVPQSCIDGIQQARDNGHLAFVVTGRTRNRCTVGGIEVDGCICGNGAYIEAQGKVLKDMKLSLEDTSMIADYLDSHGFDYFMEGNDGLYGSKHFEENAVVTYEKYGIKQPFTIRGIYPLMTFPESMHLENITKINYILHEYDDYTTFKSLYPQFKCLTWGGQGELALFGDCALPGIDKAQAIDELIAYLGYQKEDIYAFGDADVDIPMFQVAGTSICVGEGREGAKKAATYITDNVKDDGIYNALKHFNLI